MRILVTVTGGCVTGVYMTPSDLARLLPTEDVAVEIADFDNLETEEDPYLEGLIVLLNAPGQKVWHAVY